MMKLRLDQILQYYDMEDDPADRIQIVMPDQDWDNPDELSVNSDLLIVVKEWTVTDMRCVDANSDGFPVLRVAISPMSPYMCSL